MTENKKGRVFTKLQNDVPPADHYWAGDLLTVFLSISHELSAQKREKV